MSQAERSERTIPATPRRRAEARRQGSLPRSCDLNTSLIWGATALWLNWQGPSSVTDCGNWLRHLFVQEPVQRAHELTFHPLFSDSSVMTVVGWLLALWIMSVAVQWLQIGPVWTPENVQPRADRVSPVDGIKRLFSASSAVRGKHWLLRLVAISGMILTTLYSKSHTLRALPGQSSEVIAVHLGELLVSMTLRLCGVLLGIAAIDLGWQWWQHEQRLRMTVEEWRMEQREARRRTGRTATDRQKSETKSISHVYPR